MNLSDFRTAYLHCVSLLIKYKQTVQYMPITTTEDPGRIRKQLPQSPPAESENFFAILKDLEKIIIPNMLHWDHPNFYAYFPCASGYASVLAEVLIAGLGIMGFSSGMCPTLIELDRIATDIYGRALSLPDAFLYEESNGYGGGIITNSASEAVYLCMLTARSAALRLLHAKYQNKHPFDNLNRLVAYCSKEAHSCVEKAAILQHVQIKLIDVTEPDYAMDIQQLQEAMNADVAAGNHPFFVLSCFGSTGTGAIDDLSKLQDLLELWPNVWYHLDGAYGGSSFILPEYKQFIDKLRRIDSLNVNPYKWTLISPPGSVLWVKNLELLQEVIVPSDIKYFGHDKPLADHMEVQTITMTRKLRGLRLYMTLRSYGKKGIIRYIRNHIFLARRFEEYIRNDPLFAQVGRVYFSLVCFCMKGFAGFSSEELTRELISRLNESRKIHLTPSFENNIFFIRFCVCYENATRKLIDDAYKLIRTFAENILTDHSFKNYSPMISHIRASDASEKRRSLDFDNVLLPPPRRSI